MARGKHAALTTRRQYEAEMQVIDRLTDQIADLKVRTRATESAAVRVPRLEYEIVELKRQLDAGCSDHLLHERIEHDDEVAELHQVIAEQRDLIEEVLQVNSHLDGFLLPKSFPELRREWGLIIRMDSVGLGTSREERRAMLFNRTSHDLGERVQQDNGATWDANLAGKGPSPAPKPVALHIGSGK